MDLSPFAYREKFRVKCTPKLWCVGLIVLLSAACSIEVQMKHEPMVARSTDAITFTAETEGGDNIVERIQAGEVDLVMNTPWGAAS